MRAVIFDFDGVLVDSEPLHFRALRESLRLDGIVIDQAEYLRSYLAYDDRGAIRLALEAHGRPWDKDQVEAIAVRKAAMFETSLKSIPFFPGAAELVRALSEEVPLAIASGALRQEIEAILDGTGLRERFAAIVGANDVTRTKPHPEPYLAAMARLESRARSSAWSSRTPWAASPPAAPRA
jgi:beta-phosphoglucomutase